MKQKELYLVPEAEVFELQSENLMIPASPMIDPWQDDGDPLNF